MENLTENKIQNFENVLKNYNPSKNISSYNISKYERAKLLGIRSQQLADGAIPCVDIKELKREYGNTLNVEIIAREELKQKTMPLMLCRKLPDGKSEYWRICDMN
jgi:DNA-directed RNA polymerase subunit K/omega